MESIETASLIELTFMLESSIDVQFQAWMAISFAAIVASFSGRDHLTLRVRTVMAILYTLAVYALFARWMTEIDRLIEMLDILGSRGIELYPAWFSAQSRIGTYILGSLVAIGSIFYFGSKIDKNVDTDT